MGRLKIRQEDNSKEVVAYISDVQPLADDLDDLTVDVNDLAGTDRTTETVKGNADDIIDLAGEGRTTETVKGNADQIKALETQLDTTSENLSGAINDLNDKVDINKAEFEQNRQETQLKTAKVEKELNDFKNTLQQVNVNQEAKQSTSGYGTISLPKNAANGQVSVSVKGNAETDEEGNTKSTIAAMKIKSVGKNVWGGEKAVTDIIKSIGNADYAYTTNVDGKDILAIKGGSEISGKVFYDRFEPNSQYTVQVVARRANADVLGGYLTILYTDGTRTNIRPNSATWEKIVITTEINKSVSSIIGTYASPNVNYYDYNTLQVEKSSQATEYEPYTESTQYIIAKKDNKIVNLRSLPNGVRDEIRMSEGKVIIRTKKHTLQTSDIVGITTSYEGITRVNTITLPNANIISEDDSGTVVIPTMNQIAGGSIIYVPENIGKYTSVDNKIYFILEEGITLEQARQQLTGITLTYQLAEPEIIPIQVSGNIVSNPSGTIYIEPAVADANVYNDGISIFEQELNIDYIDKIAKVDYTTGIKTPLDVSQAVISEDRKSFTHPDLVNGDMVFFEYYYSNETTQGEATVEYYDSRYVIPDKTLPDKYYKWDIEVDNGVPNVIVTEV